MIAGVDGGGVTVTGSDSNLWLVRLLGRKFVRHLNRQQLKSKQRDLHCP